MDTDLHMWKQNIAHKTVNLDTFSNAISNVEKLSLQILHKILRRLFETPPPPKHIIVVGGMTVVASEKKRKTEGSVTLFCTSPFFESSHPHREIYSQ